MLSNKNTKNANFLFIVDMMQNQISVSILISTFIPTMKKIASLQNRSNYYSNNHWTNLLIGMATTLPKTQLAS